MTHPSKGSFLLGCVINKSILQSSMSEEFVMHAQELQSWSSFFGSGDIFVSNFSVKKASEVEFYQKGGKKRPQRWKKSILGKKGLSLATILWWGLKKREKSPQHKKKNFNTKYQKKRILGGTAKQRGWWQIRLYSDHVAELWSSQDLFNLPC